MGLKFVATLSPPCRHLGCHCSRKLPKKLSDTPTPFPLLSVDTFDVYPCEVLNSLPFVLFSSSHGFLA